MNRDQPRKASVMCIPFFTKTLVSKKNELISIDIYKPPVVRTTFRAVKLDLGDLNEHVGIKGKNGFFKELRFTPENPKEFVSTAREILELNC
jgi:hypothetical protein